MENKDTKTKARIPALDSTELDGQTWEALSFIIGRDEDLPNLFKTLLHHPDLLRPWSRFADQILFNSSLSPRHRELLILRTGFLCHSEYEQVHHTRLAREAGITEVELEHIKSGIPCKNWSDKEVLLVRAAEELIATYHINDTTFESLRKLFNTQQLIEIIFTVGQYCLVSMVCNSLGVQIEAWAGKAS